MEARGPAGARRDPAGVQAEIEQVQRRIATTLDELADRAKPANVARRGAERLREAGGRLADEARAVVSGGAVRLDSRTEEPPEGSIRLKGEDEVVSTYTTRGQLPPEALILGAGIGAAVVVGVVALVRRKRRGG
ncbi:DUF3618 domain-containing protein [Nocardiopsis suaedae]|uniref:DUF3618 domain-containing protein n=1 Tax=Nocardiopsis suaedae TaxID=3018444 RepID=A0ABT4TG82_9ACTN|nr:DUF3618 domain-containing protein [Nocardiopsis suaedae]MDA2803723.1 DUF3618 domain-containing protein [Nocardiopsis suaedae]